MHAWMHSCGHVNDVIGEWVECELDVVNLQQPRNLGIEEIGRRYRGRICFESLCDIQATLPRGDVRAIEEEAALVGLDAPAVEVGGEHRPLLGAEVVVDEDDVDEALEGREEEAGALAVGIDEFGEEGVGERGVEDEVGHEVVEAAEELAGGEEMGLEVEDRGAVGLSAEAAGALSELLD